MTKYSWRILYVRLCPFRAFSMRDEIHLSYFWTIHVNQTTVKPHRRLYEIFLVYSRNSINNFDAIYKHA